jgi:hypothetical protein
MRVNVAVTLGFCLWAAAVPASAQNPSYEGRGYGGPLYVGPNFQQGGQHTPPVYGTTKPAKKQAPAAKPRKETVKVRKPPVRKERESVAAKTPAPAQDDTSGTVPDNAAENTADTASASSATTCKKFDSTAGQTITIPCQ